MNEKVIIAGAGGQGIMLIGKVLAIAAMRRGFHVTWLPSYGAEVRGGTAYCMVIISRAPIGSPYIDRADTLIVMNEPSLKKFRSRLKAKGTLIINSSLVGVGAGAGALRFPFTERAGALGNGRVANMIALGVYSALKGIIDESTSAAVLEEIAPPDKRALIAVNQRALSEGIGMLKKGCV